MQRRTLYRGLAWLFGSPVLLFLLFWATGELWMRPEMRGRLPLLAGAAAGLLVLAAWVSVRRGRR